MRGPPALIEIFAGSGTLSSIAVVLGCSTLPVDWRGNRHTQKARALHLDLSTAAGQEEFRILLRRLLSEAGEVVVWIAPPCGTASRARGCQ